ncbi:ribonuclease H-like domain-containing protein, partial [Tanacetum coccineum]
MNKLVKGNLVRGLPSKLFENDQTCVACQKGKQHVQNIVTDDYSRFSWVFFLATKDKTSGIFKSFITGVENLIDQRVKVIRCDNRTEFKNKEMNQFCERKGKFDGKDDEGLFVGKWTKLAFFYIDALTKSMNYKPVVEGNQSNSNVGDDEKKVTEEPEKEGGDSSKDSESNNQEKEDNVNSTNTINAASTDEVNDVGAKTSIKLLDDPNMPEFKDIVYSDDDEDVGAEADMNKLDAFMPVSPILTTRIHKDHPVEQIIRDLNSIPQTRRMTKNLEEHEPKKVIHALKDPSWIEAMQEELLQFKLQEVWTLVDLPNGKRAMGTKWVFRNKKDERGIVIKNKARLVAQGYTQEEGIDYDEVSAPVERIKAI